MPFRRRMFRSKRRMPRKRFRRRFKRRTFRRRRPVLDPERKVLDIPVTILPTLTGMVAHENSIAGGFGFTQRIGNRALFVSYQIKSTMTRNAGLAANLSNLVRMVVLIDHRPNQTVLLVGDYLQLAATPIESPRNLNNNKRFTVLMDTIFKLSPQVPVRTVKKFFKLRLNTTWVNDMGPVVNITQGALYLIQWSEAAVVGVAPTITQVSRLRFVG